MVEALRREFDVEFEIATVDTTIGVSIFDYSLALAREWKPGGESAEGCYWFLQQRIGSGSCKSARH